MNALVKLERRGPIAVVTLDNPQSLNAINAPMRDAIVHTMETLNADAQVRAIVLTGAGDRAFSSGQDLAEAAAFRTEEVNDWMRHQAKMFRALRNLDKPLVVAFNGTAAGTGFQIGLVADIRVGYPEMSIGQPEVRVGLASILGSWLMTLYLGQADNVQMSLLGELITGQRAKELGLLNYLVPKDQVLARALEVAGEFAKLPATALKLTKERLRILTQAGFDEACDAVARYHTEEYATGEPQKIMRGFLEERSQRRAAKEKAH